LFTYLKRLSIIAFEQKEGCDFFACNRGSCKADNACCTYGLKYTPHRRPLSRGAQAAVFIDSEPLAIKAVKENLSKTKLENAQIIRMTADKAIEQLTAENKKFNIIFLDPPYKSRFEIQKLFSVLEKDGVIIAETQNDFDADEKNLYDTRIYGRTKLLFYR
jgi:16S rRNA G966 N2-methylase RsmD